MFFVQYYYVSTQSDQGMTISIVIIIYHQAKLLVKIHQEMIEKAWRFIKHRNYQQQQRKIFR